MPGRKTLVILVAKLVVSTDRKYAPAKLLRSPLSSGKGNGQNEPRTIMTWITRDADKIIADDTQNKQKS